VAGFERAPRSIASKFLTCVWFAFVTITLVTYTAGIVNNLYWASMTHRSTPTRPRYLNLAHVVNAKDINYGTVVNSQTYWFVVIIIIIIIIIIITTYWRYCEDALHASPASRTNVKTVLQTAESTQLLLKLDL